MESFSLMTLTQKRHSQILLRDWKRMMEGYNVVYRYYNCHSLTTVQLALDDDEVGQFMLRRASSGIWQSHALQRTCL